MILDTSKAKRLWPYLRPYWRLEAVTLFLQVALTALALALPAAIQYMIDSLIPSLTADAKQGINLSKVLYFGMFLAGIYLAQVLFTTLRDYVAGRVGASIIADLRSQLFRHLESLSLKFFQTHQVGEMMSRLLSDVGRIQQLLSTTLVMFLSNILFLLGVLIYLLNINWILTLVAVIPVPLTIILTNRFGIRLNAIARTLQETYASLSARIQESLLGVKTVKAFGQEDAERVKVETVLNRLTRLYVQNSVVSSLAINFVNLINMLGPIVVLAWGTWLVASGEIMLGSLIAFYILLTFLYSPIQGLASLHIEVKSAMASVDRILEYLDIAPTIKEDPQPAILDGARGEIRFQNINFAYAGNGFRVKNLSLTINAKEKVAIVGPSGAGKTTLINLIMRFYDPEEGRITLDGLELSKLSLQSLRNSVALVDQDPLLFKTSIFDNIAYSNPLLPRDAVVRAAKIANIHDFISGLPNGYDSEVGERGVSLSGGEKQRICLARAIIKNPAVLILDEATSALDSQSEALIQEALDKILVDKTAIIIAHRFSTVRRADRIVLMDQGRIVDQGKHEELMARSLLYRELAEKQMIA